MFELFKKRDFGELFNDTFVFFKLKWKNYFGNYLKINFLILVAFMVLGYILSKFYMDAVFGSLNNPNQFGNQIGDYYMDNIEWLIFTGLGMFVVVIIISVFQMIYPFFFFWLFVYINYLLI